MVFGRLKKHQFWSVSTLLEILAKTFPREKIGLKEEVFQPFLRF